jgi:hypothetical protein
MPHRVHAMVQHVQPAGLDAVVYGIEGKSERHELPPGHHAVLSFGERRDQRIRRTRSISTAYIRHNFDRVSHGGMVASFVCRFHARLHQLRAGVTSAAARS